MLLDQINSPDDLKKLAPDQLPQVAKEIRQFMINTVSNTGGHLASSLGAVEIILALHYCFDLPRDRIVFDVGHQAYAHKIITGRKKDFSTLRQYGGISGFPSKNESVFDTAISGHSSTSVSVALGLVCSRDTLDKMEQFRVAAVIGDGSLSGGICIEGLNNAGHLKKDLLVVLNTNELSIAPNVGAISTYLNKLISMPIYNRFRESLDRFLESRVPKGRRLKKIAAKFEEGLKGLFIPGVLFEELGFRYFGPLDGHNLEVLIPTIKNILEIKGPRLLHVLTRKGKGYAPAEKDPVRFHSMGPFEFGTGQPALAENISSRTYTEVFGDAITSLAKNNQSIVAITAAMPEGTGLDKFRDAYPQRFFDVGIAEEHAVCFAAGMALGGLTPVVAIYSTFFQRAYDQIIEDIALPDLGVVFCLDRAGIVGEDGVTHQGLFDIASLRPIPNLVIMSPKDGQELTAMLAFSIALKKPVVIRYPKAFCPAEKTQITPIELGKPEIIKEGKDYTIVALGSMVFPCVEAAELLKKQGISGTVINARFVKPLDKVCLEKMCAKGPVFCVEEGVINSGFGSAVSDTLQQKVFKIGLPDQFITHGKRSILLEIYGLTKEGVAKQVKEKLNWHG
jgi:1-deoxy-D-xylulose-5-phosphate synthase